MAPILPIGKFFALAAKQLAKPVSQILLKYTLTHEVTRDRCLAVGQFLHRVNLRISRLAEGQNVNKVIIPLSEEKALDSGATFLGEVFVFSIGAAVLASEYVRSQKKTKELENLKIEENYNKELQFKAQQFEINRRIQNLENQLSHMRREKSPEKTT